MAFTKLKIQDQDGNITEIPIEDAAKYGIDATDAVTQLEAQTKLQGLVSGSGAANENTQEAIAAMQEAVSGALQADPKANKRGLYYKWIRANEPTFKGLGIDSAALWGVHETTPEQTIEQQDMATTEQQQNQGPGLIQRLTSARQKAVEKGPTWPFGSRPPGSNILDFLKNLRG